MPLVVSVMGFSRDELAGLVARVGARDEVAMIELNVSCPNVESGLIMGADPAETARAVERVRPLTEQPLIVKLTPNATDPAAVARRGRGRRGGRAVADQHAQGHGARPARAAGRGSAAAPAGSRGPPCGRSRSSRSSSVARERRDSGDRDGRHRLGPRRGRLPGRRRRVRRRRHRELPRPGAPAAASAPSSPDWRARPRQGAQPSGMAARPIRVSAGAVFP